MLLKLLFQNLFYKLKTVICLYTKKISSFRK